MNSQDFEAGTSTHHQVAHLLKETLLKREEGAKSPEIVEYFKKQLSKSTVQYLQAITVLTPFGQAPAESWQSEVDAFVEGQVGPEASPAVKLMAEHALIMHHASCSLRQSTAGVLDPEIVRNNHSLANQLSGELRRLLRDLEESCISQKPARPSAKSSSSANAAESTKTRRRKNVA